MRIIVVFREFSDHGREVESFLRDFEKRTGREIEIKNPDDRNNEFFLRAYDIVEYPTILAISDDGALQNMWKGRPLPTIDEVSFYAK